MNTYQTPCKLKTWPRSLFQFDCDCNVNQLIHCLSSISGSTKRKADSADHRTPLPHSDVLRRWNSNVGAVSVNRNHSMDPGTDYPPSCPHFRWNEQKEYMNASWNCGKFLATVFVLVNLLGQVGGVVMVIGRIRVQIACGLLFFIVVLQASCLPFNCATG